MNLGVLAVFSLFQDVGVGKLRKMERL